MPAALAASKPSKLEKSEIIRQKIRFMRRRSEIQISFDWRRRQH